MTKRTLLPMLLTALLPAYAPAQKAGDSTPPKTNANTSKGKASAQAVANYLPKVKAAFAKRWGDAVTARMAEFSHGDINVTFKLDAEGKVTDFAVAANTSNAAFAKFCEQFIRETKFDKPPASALTDGQIEIPFTFTIL